MQANPNSRLQVLLVISNLGYGGAERQVVALANGLGQHGIDASIAVLSGHVPLATQLSDASRLHIVGKSPLRLARLIDRLQIDVVHGFLLDAEILSCLAVRFCQGVRVIGSERSTRHRYSWWQIALYRAVSSPIHLWVANTEEGARWHAHTFSQSAARYAVIRNGVDVERFQAGSGTAVREALGITDGEPLIGMFASIKPVKNHDLLLDAVAVLRQRGRTCKVLFVGDRMHQGRHANTTVARQLALKIHELGLDGSVLMLGHRDDVEALYRACSVTVLPSVYEGTPNVVLESMACGIPAILSDVPGNREAVIDGQGAMLFEAGNAGALADALENVLADPGRLAALRVLARTSVVERFAMARMLREMAETYRLQE